MKPPRFDYVVATSVEDALDALGHHSEARLLAGGQSLVPLMNLRLAQPGLLVDINRIEGLDGIRVHDDGSTELGALCRHRQVERSAAVVEAAPLLAEAMSHVGHLAIRNRGTLGGIVAHADPSSEIPAALLALGAEVVASSSRGRRQISADAFFAGYFTNTLAADEMVTGVIVPPATAARSSAFVEFAPRDGDYAVVGVAAVVTRDDAGRCAGVRLAACGVADRPVDLSEAASDLIGAVSLEDALARSVAARVAEVVHPTDDIRATSEDRRELTQLLVVNALRTALERPAQEVRR